MVLINYSKEIKNAKKKFPLLSNDELIKFLATKFKKENYLSNAELEQVESELYERLSGTD